MSFAKAKRSITLVLMAASVWVTRPDGSLQCDEKLLPGVPTRIELVRQELEKKGIRVLESKERNDGQMRAQACGISTGNETAFRIGKKDLTQAKKLGFVEIPRP